jgi:hypothetical protein
MTAILIIKAFATLLFLAIVAWLVADTQPEGTK